MINAPDLPLIEEIHICRSPGEIFDLFCRGEGRMDKGGFFLDSSLDPQKLGRYSILGNNPFLMLTSRGEDVVVEQNGSLTRLKGNPFDVLGRYLETYRLDVSTPELPCAGGAVGFFSYDLCHFIERLPAKAVDDLQLPECCFGFFDLMLVFDNLAGKAFIVSTGFPELEPARRKKRARERLEETRDRLAVSQNKPGIQSPESAVSSLLTPDSQLLTPGSNFTHEAYVRAVERARQYIIDGDIFEVNISQRYETELSITPYQLYRRLRQINPAPFSAYLDFDEVTVVGSSPERFLRCRGDWVETRPIKGTIRRGKTPEEDAANAQWLLNSAKDHAENMMIVDLERNDLGRVCRYGTVKVTELAILETYPTVFHLTSTVEGRLRAGVSRIDLLKATFPGGSITGAPKIRSMEIIDELEPTRRSVYTGSLGYISFDGSLDLNIVIRTFLVKGKRAYFQMGGAVVYDSDPESEYQETLDKGLALFNALQRRGQGTESRE